MKMSDEKDYVSILDGAEDDVPIVIIPDDDENEERDYSNHTSYISAVVGEQEQKPAEKEKRTFLSVIRNFWYYHKITVIIVIFVIAAFAALFASFFSKKTNDLTVAVYSENYYSDTEKLGIKLLLSEHIEDYNSDDMYSVEADFMITDNEDYTPSQIAADYESRVRCIYLTTEEAYEYIIGLYPDIFESYNGCDEWIPLSGTDLCKDFLTFGADVSDLGISLLAKPDGESENYERSVALLGKLKELYPEVFE